MAYKFKLNGKRYEANVVSDTDNIIEIELNGKRYTVEVEREQPKPRPAAPIITPTAAQMPSAPTQPQNKPAKVKKITSPLPGVVLDVKVQPGDAVKRGQVVMILEAMKMENEIEATDDGIVSSISKSKGDSVMEGDTLIVLQ
ncbi:MAG: biotin/lipoyl-binding protein [Bacteroidales bacterium]|jgi:biotin carboxyl carrier protein|nr:biotin/lipoyl-binding protein [Bacteroidales bacterium]MBP5420101.1 biotin/lipoyl-binding protein [Bacteroidales bacterium]MCR5697672.1 biotin/lipoyl-binding protein [Marinilabiliaceae bacterium]